MILFLVGLFCFLLVIGFFVTGGEAPLHFAGMAMVVLAALVFVGFLGIMAWAIFFSH